MEEELEFENGIERLEFLIGADINKIMSVLERLAIPNSKEIIELRFGIRDGKEYTLLEVADILNKKETNKSVIDWYLDSIHQIDFKPLFSKWDMEAVRKTEATTIRIIKNVIENNLI